MRGLFGNGMPLGKLSFIRRLNDMSSVKDTRIKAFYFLNHFYFSLEEVALRVKFFLILPQV